MTAVFIAQEFLRMCYIGMGLMLVGFFGFIGTCIYIVRWS